MAHRKRGFGGRVANPGHGENTQPSPSKSGAGPIVTAADALEIAPTGTTPADAERRAARLVAAALRILVVAAAKSASRLTTRSRRWFQWASAGWLLVAGCTWDAT